MPWEHDHVGAVAAGQRRLGFLLEPLQSGSDGRCVQPGLAGDPVDDLVGQAHQGIDIGDVFARGAPQHAAGQRERGGIPGDDDPGAAAGRGRVALQGGGPAACVAGGRCPGFDCGGVFHGLGPPVQDQAGEALELGGYMGRQPQGA